MWYIPDYTGIIVIDEKEVATPKKVTLFKVFAYTMVSGHVGGRLITHAEAQLWLAESLESRMLLRVAKRGQQMFENLVKLKNLEAATEEQAFEDATSQEARTYQATKHAVDEDKQAIEKLSTGLNSLNDKYSQIPGQERQWLQPSPRKPEQQDKRRNHKGYGRMSPARSASGDS